MSAFIPPLAASSMRLTYSLCTPARSMVGERTADEQSWTEDYVFVVERALDFSYSARGASLLMG